MSFRKQALCLSCSLWLSIAEENTTEWCCGWILWRKRHGTMLWTMIWEWSRRAWEEVADESWHLNDTKASSCGKILDPGRKQSQQLVRNCEAGMSLQRMSRGCLYGESLEQGMEWQGEGEKVYSACGLNVGM